MDAIDILIREYETLRQEILTTMANRNTILSFGLASVGAIFTASIAFSKENSLSLLGSLMLIIGLPAIDLFVIYIWLGEYQRMQRAGKFIMGLEHRINEEAKRTLLSWETNLRMQRSHMKYPYNTTVMLLTCISLVSITFGLISLRISILHKLLIGSAGLVISLIIYFSSLMKIRKLQR